MFWPTFLKHQYIGSLFRTFKTKLNIYSSIRFCFVFSLNFKPFFQITPFTREFPVKNKFQFDDIFNDTSIHIFPVERLLEIPSPLWENCKEPKYDPDLQLEIILRD